jgi:hypothetical protein
MQRGTDNNTIYQQLLGMTQERLSDLRDKGVI